MLIMKHLPALIILVFIPLYVLSVFVSFVFAPTEHIARTHNENEKLNLIILLAAGIIICGVYLVKKGSSTNEKNQLQE